MVIAKKFVLVNAFKGEPKPTDLQLVEEEMRPIIDGEFLVEAEYLSVDPYMRLHTDIQLGNTMIGCQVAKIIESKNREYMVGQRIVGSFGWRTHTILDPRGFEDAPILKTKPYLLPDFGNLPPSFALGVLGMPGNTALFGLQNVCKPKHGETIVVSGAAGAVGSHVGQIAKVQGLKVIGIAGSDKKCDWLVSELGFDHAINYKTQDICNQLKKAAPNGIDCYFDNVGGEISASVIYQMNYRGRICICGCISSYNNDITEIPKVTALQPAILLKSLKMEGFAVYHYNDCLLEGIHRNLELIKEKKLQCKETVTEGFENMFEAFIGMMQGQNFGKAIVKVKK